EPLRLVGRYARLPEHETVRALPVAALAGVAARGVEDAPGPRGVELHGSQQEAVAALLLEARPRALRELEISRGEPPLELCAPGLVGLAVRVARRVLARDRGLERGRARIARRQLERPRHVAARFRF